MSFPAQGYTPTEIDPNAVIGTAPAPETVIGEKINVFILKNTNVFAAALSPTGLLAGDQKIFSITVCASPGKKILVTYDNGVINHKLNQDVALRDKSLYTFNVFVKEGDLFNIQFDGDVTMQLLRIGEVQ